MRVVGLLAAIAVLSACGEAAPTPDTEGAEEAGAAPVLEAKQAETGKADNQPSATRRVTCGPEETTIFACTTEGDKTIAVCSQGKAGATYRFGGETPEIELSGGQWARTGYSGGGELQIAFDSGDTRYVVFSRTVRTNFKADEPNYPAMSDGVVVLQDGRFRGLQRCRDDSDASYYGEESEAAMQKLPQSDDLFTYETGRADRVPDRE